MHNTKMFTGEIVDGGEAGDGGGGGGGGVGGVGVGVCSIRGGSGRCLGEDVQHHNVHSEDMNNDDDSDEVPSDERNHQQDCLNERRRIMATRHHDDERHYAADVSDVAVDVDNDDLSMAHNSYNDLSMTKIRCHQREMYAQHQGTQHLEHSSQPSTSHRHIHHQQLHHQHAHESHGQHQQHVAAAPQSVINLGRCGSSSLDTLVAAEAAAALSPTASSTSSASLQHQQHMYALQQHHHHVQEQQASIHHHHHHHPQQHGGGGGTPHVANYHHGHHPKLHPCTNSTMVSSTALQSAVHDNEHLTNTSSSTSSASASSAAAAAAAAAAANRRDHNIDYSLLFVQLSGTLPTLYRCVSCNKIVSNRWHHANIHRPQSHECPVCGQKFTRRDNMKAHCKIKHADIKDRFFSHYVHM